MRQLIIGLTLVVALTPACGKNSPTPTAPTPTPTAPTPPSGPTVTSLTLDGPQAVSSEFSATYTATATLSDGTTTAFGGGLPFVSQLGAATPSWTTSNPSVATVSSGRLSGQSHGSATLTVTYRGASASMTVNVVQNYTGTWDGTYVIRACNQSGSFATQGWCQGLGGVGAVLPISVRFIQGVFGDLSGVSRVFAISLSLGSLSGTSTVSGNVTEDGRLTASGFLTVNVEGRRVSIAIGAWDSRVSAPSQMSGRWAQTVTGSGIAGNAYQENELVTMTRTSTTATVTTAPLDHRLTWPELFSRMR